MNWYMKVIKDAVDFNGRSRRKEFWMFQLFNFIISIVLGVISAVVGDTDLVLSTMYGLMILIPSLSVLVRRLHDTGRSGWWFFIILIPFVGAVVLLVFECLDSEPGVNQYGQCPKDDDSIKVVAA